MQVVLPAAFPQGHSVSLSSARFAPGYEPPGYAQSAPQFQLQPAQVPSGGFQSPSGADRRMSRGPTPIGHAGHAGPDGLNASLRALPPPTTNSMHRGCSPPVMMMSPRQSGGPEASRSQRQLPHRQQQPSYTPPPVNGVEAANNRSYTPQQSSRPDSIISPSSSYAAPPAAAAPVRAPVGTPPVTNAALDNLQAQIQEQMLADNAAALLKIKEELRAEAGMFRDEMKCSFEEFARSVQRTMADLETDVADLRKQPRAAESEDVNLVSPSTHDDARHIEAIAQKLNAYHENALSVNSDVTKLSDETEALRAALQSTQDSLRALEATREAERANVRGEHIRLEEATSSVRIDMEVLGSRIEQELCAIREETDGIQQGLQETNQVLAGGSLDERLAQALDADHAHHSETLDENMHSLQGKLDGELATLREEAASAGSSVVQLNVESATLRSQLCELCTLLTGEAEEMSRQVVSIEASSELKCAALQRTSDVKLTNMDVKIEHLTGALINEEMALEEAVQHLQSQMISSPANRNRPANTGSRPNTSRSGPGIRIGPATGNRKSTEGSRMSSYDDQRYAAAMEKLQHDSDMRVISETQKREAAEVAVLKLTAELSDLRVKIHSQTYADASAREAAKTFVEERTEVIEQRETRAPAPAAAPVYVTTGPTIVMPPMAASPYMTRATSVPYGTQGIQRPAPVQVQRPNHLRSASDSSNYTSAPPIYVQAGVAPQSPRSPHRAQAASPERSGTTTTTKTMKVTRSVHHHGGGGSAQFSSVGAGNSGGVDLPNALEDGRR